MKKLTLLLATFVVVILMSTSANAQSRVGAGLAYGNEIESAGIGVNGEFFATDKLSISPSFIFYFPKNDVDYWEINGNVNYYFTDGAAAVYGLAGLNLSRISVDLGPFGDASDSELGVNLGIGSNFDIGSSILPFAEAKYVISDADQLSLLAGVRFSLN
ncbi:MAG: outer membrane beta-barrel protein [Cyclobacteriaceae bacterium]|nr:outer membrane beta-barrel protein [Cyclobacteriaceae bacterium HetDA_MAG_MS6]